MILSSVWTLKAQESPSNPMTAGFSLLPTSANDLFKCPEKFGYFADSQDCAKYFVCVFGEALHESCTGGLYFSAELQTCDWPRNVLCLQGSSSSVNPGRSEDEDNGENDELDSNHDDRRSIRKKSKEQASLSSLSVFDEVDDAGIIDSEGASKIRDSSPGKVKISPVSSQSSTKSSREDYDLIADKFKHHSRNNHSSSSLSLSSQENEGSHNRHHFSHETTVLSDSKNRYHQPVHHYQLQEQQHPEGKKKNHSTSSSSISSNISNVSRVSHQSDQRHHRNRIQSNLPDENEIKR